MPSRGGREKIVHGGPQGKDAWVKLRRLTVEESRDMQREVNDLEAGSEEQEQRARELYAKYVLDWNFVDDNDQPLPKPQGNPDVIGQLLTDELNWIVASLMSMNPEEKKDRKR